MYKVKHTLGRPHLDLPLWRDALRRVRRFGEPIHIYVAKQRGYAKFWLRPLELEKSRNFRAHELNEIAQLTEEHRDEIQRKWRDHFGRET